VGVEREIRCSEGQWDPGLCWLHQ